MPELSVNGHRHVEPVRRSDARLARIERRLTEIHDSGETRVTVLRDAVSDFIAAELASRDEAIALLQKQNAELVSKLEAKTAVDQQVAEIAKRLDAQAIAREEALRGKTGPLVSAALAAKQVRLERVDQQVSPLPTAQR